MTKGVTLVLGGGFHGKSTLLEALQVGVYDGKEFVVTKGTAVKVGAEDLSLDCTYPPSFLTLHTLQLWRFLWLHQPGC